MMHIVIRQQFQLGLRLLQQRIPREVWAREEICRVELVVAHADIAKFLKDIGKQINISSEIQVMVITHALASKLLPYFLSVSVILGRNTLTRQLAVESVKGWKLCLLKAPQLSVYS